MVTFTICTNWVAPTAPLVSGGTNAKPKTLRLSWALCPSKLLSKVTPVSGPANGAATGSVFGLVIIGPVERAVRVWLSVPPLLDEPPITIRDKGDETSLREALITSGPFARANGADRMTKTKERNHGEQRTGLVRVIEPPDTRSIGDEAGILIPSAKKLQLDSGAGGWLTGYPKIIRCIPGYELGGLGRTAS